jgi:ABC-type antimicrobial peptide transport system permease subunit
MAVGARSRDVMGLVMKHSLRLVGVGAVVGAVGGGIAATSLRSMLFGVSVADPLAVGGATAILFLVALAASMLPALRAVRVDPLESLRAE